MIFTANVILCIQNYTSCVIMLKWTLSKKAKTKDTVTIILLNRIDQITVDDYHNDLRLFSVCINNGNYIIAPHYINICEWFVSKYLSVGILCTLNSFCATFPNPIKMAQKINKINIQFHDDEDPNSCLQLLLYIKSN